MSDSLPSTKKNGQNKYIIYCQVVCLFYDEVFLFFVYFFHFLSDRIIDTVTKAVAPGKSLDYIAETPR